MIELIVELTKAFRSVIPESFYLKNNKETVIYPYLTFTYTGEPLGKNTKGFYLDIDIFDDKGKNNERIEQAMSDLVDFVDDDENRIMTDELFIRFDSIKPNPIPTNSDILQRRYAQVYVRSDWRNK
ncbi:MAG: hypothetical protein LKF42_00390 [Streptococcaceae bacterium]|jgi:hypothetical protein|nr:hypothetical protein [Streptococcaceae bacterium]MCH4176190.1 hypothetical protein [Streptococcaceae bacterium]